MAQSVQRLSDLRDVRRDDGKLLYATPVARLLECAISIADADSEDDEAWHRSWMRLRKTLVETGWTPPPRDHDAGLADRE